MLVSGLPDVLRGESLVDAAMTLPEDDAAALDFFAAIPAEETSRQAIVPYRQLLRRHPHVDCRDTTEVLVGEEEDVFAARERPAQHGGRIAGRETAPPLRPQKA
jgi:hypothetical protein